MGTTIVQKGGRGGIRWGLNLFLLFVTGGLWIFAFPWWPRHWYGGANAAAVSSSVVNVHTPAAVPAPPPPPPSPVVHAPTQPPAAVDDPAEQLRTLKALHDDGILTSDEYEVRRSALVARLSPPPPSVPPRPDVVAELDPPNV